MRNGHLMKICRKKHKRFHFFLFNDALMYGEDNISGLCLFHRSLPLFTVTIVDIPDSDQLQNAFQIVRGGNQSMPDVMFADKH